MRTPSGRKILDTPRSRFRLPSDDVGPMWEAVPALLYKTVKVRRLPGDAVPHAFGGEVEIVNEAQHSEIELTGIKMLDAEKLGGICLHQGFLILSMGSKAYIGGDLNDGKMEGIPLAVLREWFMFAGTSLRLVAEHECRVVIRADEKFDATVCLIGRRYRRLA